MMKPTGWEIVLWILHALSWTLQLWSYRCQVTRAVNTCFANQTPQNSESLDQKCSYIGPSGLPNTLNLMNKFTDRSPKCPKPCNMGGALNVDSPANPKHRKH